MKTTGWTPAAAAIGLGLLLIAGGASAQTLRDAELRKLATSAKTPADHKRIAAHYRAHAAEHEADAKLHEELVAAFRKNKADDDAWDLARDAAHYAEHSREAAEALRELAELHEAIATRAAAR
jgi:hypothetical protein